MSKQNKSKLKIKDTTKEKSKRGRKKKIDDDLINSIVLKLKNHPLCYEEKANYYSSYFTPPNKRPEKKLKKFYDSIINQATKYLEAFKNHPYVFNLGHGILPETNPDIKSNKVC